MLSNTRCEGADQTKAIRVLKEELEGRDKNSSRRGVQQTEGVGLVRVSKGAGGLVRGSSGLGRIGQSF